VAKKGLDLNPGPISSTFYEQLLGVQIPKVQKKTVKLSVFFVLVGSAHVKAAHGTLMKLTPGIPISKLG